MFKNMTATSKPKGNTKTRQAQKKNSNLPKKIALKEVVIAEIMENYITVKKELCGALTEVWVPIKLRGGEVID